MTDTSVRIAAQARLIRAAADILNEAQRGLEREVQTVQNPFVTEQANLLLSKVLNLRQQAASLENQAYRF